MDANNNTNPNCFDGNHLDPVPKLPLCTGGIFATYPAPHLSLANGFLDQVHHYVTIWSGSLAFSAADKEKNRAFYEESMKIGTHGQNYILNKMRPKATSGLTFGDLYIPNKSIYVIDF